MTVTEGAPRSLAGRRVIVTREHPGALADLLTARGAVVVHVPMIAVGDPPDGGAALRRELDALDSFEWLVVTSPEGARRVAAAAAASSVRLAAVGTATARALGEAAGRAVDVVPATQRATALAAALVSASEDAAGGRVLVAQADRAAGDVGVVLRDAGLEVVEVTAYSTSISSPTREADRSSSGETSPPAPSSVAAADAVLFASGSAVRGWLAEFGSWAPPVVVAIGPSTAAVATELGLDITGIAADHSLEGLVGELEAHLA